MATKGGRVLTRRQAVTKGSRKVSRCTLRLSPGPTNLAPKQQQGHKHLTVRGSERLGFGGEEGVCPPTSLTLCTVACRSCSGGREEWSSSRWQSRCR